MSIMESRIRKAQQKRKRRSKRFIITITSLSVSFILGTFAIGALVYKQYRDTHKWDKSTITGTYAQIPAEFAKDHISADIVDDINSLSVVNKSLERVKKDNGLTRSTIDEARNALNKSKSILEKHKIESGDIKEKENLLALYIDIYDVEQTAYENFDVDKLSSVMTKLSTQVVQHNHSYDIELQKRLNTIATDYNNLNSFLDTYIPSLGNVQNGVVTVRDEIGRDVTDEMLKTISDEKLDKFDNIETLQQLLRSSKWEKVIKNTESLSDKKAWGVIREAFEALSKTSYIKVSDISDYEDAINAGFGVTGIEARDGYIVTTTSPVSKLTLNGAVLKSSQYVKRGANVIATVNAIYEKDPNYREQYTPSTTPSTSKTSSSSSSYETSSTESHTDTQTESSVDTSTEPSSTTSSTYRDSNGTTHYYYPN